MDELGKNAHSGSGEVAVIHSDGAIVVIDKPAGMFVHRAPGHSGETVCDALLRLFPDMAGVGSVERPGVVHRLDCDTSGVMVFARTRSAYLSLRRAFEEHGRVEKTYLAVLHGAPKPACGTLDTLVGRKSWDSKRMAVDGVDGRRAVTHWRVLGRSGGLALVEFKIDTGRMHQIRVHAAHLGHPVAGDPLYGDAAKDARMRRPPARTLLHAATLAFPHPETGRRVEFSAPPPYDIVYC